MAIYRLIANGSFGPDEIDAMTAAYEGALIDLRLSDRDDPITELIAKSIVNVTAIGEVSQFVSASCGSGWFPVEFRNVR